MDGSRHDSLDEAGLAASTLRRRSYSPAGHRSPLRRASASISLLESEKQMTCLSRDTWSDDCALHRFVTWAAVKRNSCANMTAEEKRECPLLRCRKRFPDHELMLKHLYSCEHLASGEYWCYACGKAEQLSDTKCRRCLGHPSRRKKVMSLAKIFFSSLGHKSRNRSLPDPELGVDQGPPCDDPVVGPPQVELQSNEIHEIDSFELPLPTILEAGEESEAEAEPSKSPSRPATARLDGAAHSGIDESLIIWEPPPTPPPPVVSRRLPTPKSAKAPERPVLQVNTLDLEICRQARSMRRSKKLTPSSSIRSTASNVSTKSTNTSSTASYCISPITAWSGAGSKAPAFESTPTSPADDLTNPADIFPRIDKADGRQRTGDHDMDLTGIATHDFLAKFSAEMPLLDLVSAIKTLRGDLGLCQQSLSLDAPMPAEQPVETSATLASSSLNMFQGPTLLAADLARHQHDANAHCLIQTARSTLEVHMANSMSKLGHDDENQLANQFRNMSADSVVTAGLETMTDVLEGRPETSPVKLLCFVHLVYSFACIVYEQDAPSRCADLFSQAMSYDAWLPPQHRQAYTQLVDLFWNPCDVADGESTEVLRPNMPRPEPKSISRKGKERADEPERLEADPLVFMAEYFLDELEDSALQDTQRPEIQASELCIEHLKDVNLQAHEGSPFSIAADSTIDLLGREYRHVPGFESSMRDILDRVKSNHVATPRRLELSLMQAGKMRLESVVFDKYIALVRKQLDPLYRLHDSRYKNSNPRLRYYRLGIRVLSLMVQQPGSEGQAGVAEAALDAAVDPLGVDGPTTTAVDDFGLGSVADLDFGMATDVDIGVAEGRDWLPTPDGTGSGGTPASPGPCNKMNASIRCELCGYRPSGNPRWFRGSMAKHKKLQHGDEPPKMYRCPFPGCTSQYKRRGDNLRQHQKEKEHFVDEDGRPSKRRKTDGQP